MLVAVIPDIFQRFQVVLDIQVFAVANEAPLASAADAAASGSRSCRAGLTFSPIEVEAVGVALIGRLR